MFGCSGICDFRHGADALGEALAKHARTDTIGDGKIWVSTLDSVLRVRTGDRDLAAI